MIYSLRYGDMTILKIAAVRRLEFSKYNIFLSRNLCHHQILRHLPKLRWNRTFGCSVMAQKTFQHGGHAPSWIWFNLISGSRICPAVQSLLLYIKVHQNTKLFSLKYGNIKIFKMATTSWIGRCPQGGEKGWKGEGKGGEEQNSSYKAIIRPITERA